MGHGAEFSRSQTRYSKVICHLRKSKGSDLIKLLMFILYIVMSVCLNCHIYKQAFLMFSEVLPMVNDIPVPQRVLFLAFWGLHNFCVKLKLGISSRISFF